LIGFQLFAFLVLFSCSLGGVNFVIFALGYFIALLILGNLRILRASSSPPLSFAFFLRLVRILIGSQGYSGFQAFSILQIFSGQFLFPGLGVTSSSGLLLTVGEASSTLSSVGRSSSVATSASSSLGLSNLLSHSRSTFMFQAGTFFL
jgi:hypothetical protein